MTDELTCQRCGTPLVPLPVGSTGSQSSFCEPCRLERQRERKLAYYYRNRERCLERRRKHYLEARICAVCGERIVEPGLCGFCIEELDGVDLMRAKS